MCGIVGFYGEGDIGDLIKMSSRLAHRGPDSHGDYVDNKSKVFLAHRRLSIIDIKYGHQPMQNQDTSISVIFNGEIYNAFHLRRNLEKLGYQFLSEHSDTEVLLHGYQEWGEDLPKHLNGMFAFAVYDRNKKQIFIARDRFGEKPLYWSKINSTFLFSSEINALKPHPLFNQEVNQTSVIKLLAYGFIPSPLSYYKNTQKLQAGHTLTYHIKNNSVYIRPYWRYKIKPDMRKRIDDGTVVEEFIFLFRQSVERRMVSDVPLGMFLSGGLDSGAVAYFANKIYDQEKNHSSLKTFSIGFSEKSFDESVYSTVLSSFLNTYHCSENYTEAIFLDTFRNVLLKLDEPIGDPSFLPTYSLCALAKNSVSVSLSGDGADELLAGYDTFKALNTAHFMEKILSNRMKINFLKILDILPKSSRNMSLDFIARRFLLGLGAGEEAWNPMWLAPATIEMISELFHKKIYIEDVYTEAINLWRSSTSEHLVDKTSEFYVRLYLQDNILPKIDKASMLNGLEVRTVFLDNDLVDFIQTLPHYFKKNRKTTKYILKEAMKDKLPHDVVYRPKKGFGIPIGKWINKIEFSTQYWSKIKANANLISSCKEAHLRRQKDYRLLLWICLVLQNHT